MMNRRKFMKNIFGAAVIAAMPKIVVDEIVKLPPEKTIFPEEDIPVHPNCRCVVQPTPPDGYLFLYDGDKLLAGSNKFSLQMKPSYLDVTTSYDMFPQYIKGPASWNITIKDLKWYDGSKSGKSYFEDNQKMSIVVKKDNKTIMGEAYITECQLTCGLYDHLIEDVVLEGTGALTILFPKG